VVRCPRLIILFSDLACNAFLLQQLADGLEEVDIQPPRLPKGIESGYGIALIAIVPDELADDGPVALLYVRLPAPAGRGSFLRYGRERPKAMPSCWQ